MRHRHRLDGLLHHRGIMEDKVLADVDARRDDHRHGMPIDAHELRLARRHRREELIIHILAMTRVAGCTSP